MNLKETIAQADMMLVGIGESFQDKQVSQAYQKLAELLAEKNYFIVTLCNDDQIFASELRQDKIVAPCGTYQKLQCENGCSNVLLQCKDIDDIEKQVCSECGGKLCFNLVGAAHYNENGYLPMWEKYTKWIQGSLNKKIVVLELGVGFAYPSVIRWPFEKIAFFNNKASFYRIHESLYQISDELHDKGVGIQENPVTFLIDQI